ncbi:ABC transporter substrate-binding protein [Peteryoungia desertarenae]|uniref:ABC transporter substrate-binding protein n=1 Tax=Peteryoungia desertarenae TaxID=1813451 RepID=A0ABX6QK35_9HYPH|nr:ABC transporter substrate-binding protein [Peteryoungia desertarenae]QLF68913.1 ABC transporter substrate-binding protein [Peteryoungia desertarenae]
MAIRRITVSAMVALALLSGTALAQPKSQLVLAIGGEPEGGYDPLTGWGRYGHPLFQSTLLTRDAELKTKPDLATEWSLSEDRLTWTIKLRAGTTFSDGSPLDAEDVAFTFNEAAKIGSAVDLTALDAARVIDAQTVEIKLKKPWITFTENFYALGIVPSDSYGEGYGRNPVGSGPYKLVSWTEGQQLIVEKNPNYYGETGPFERITFLFTEEDTSLAAAQAGQVDMVSVPATAADAPPQGFKQIVTQSVDNRGIVFPFVKDEGKTVGDGKKVGNNVTSDFAIRRAINLGIDRNQLVEVALLGHGSPASGPADGLPWSNPEAALAFDLDQARKVLDDAGWSLGTDGVRVKDGQRAAFPINYPASDSTRRALAETVSEQLKALGIEATATGKSWDEIGRIMHSEPVLFGWGSHSQLEVYNLYQSSLGGVEFYNAGFYANPAVDQHFAAAQNAASLEASFADWGQAEWDGTTGFGARGDAAWAWLVNLNHIYYVTECLDIGPTQIEPHGHGWPITAMMQNWKWTCE